MNCLKGSPLSQAAESAIVHRLIDRLNNAFSLDLCIDPRTEREKKELEGRAIDTVGATE